MITKSGADYAYIMETFGPFMAFVRLWIECMIVRPCSQAIVALTFSVYVLKPFFPNCQPPEEATTMLAICCICESKTNLLCSNYQLIYSSKLNNIANKENSNDAIITVHYVLVVLTFINCWDVKWATKVQDIFTFAKLLALFVIIATGGYQLYLGI